jgi:Raf kinase inhibitor-like YbhB/YbcL family protein
LAQEPIMNARWTPAGILGLAACLVAVSGISFPLRPRDVSSLLAEGGTPAMLFAISSTSFPSAGDIPKKYTCDGADVSPELSWSGAPSSTKSFALIADDPDAPVGTWTHWVLFDLPPSTASLPEGLSKVAQLPGGGRQGENDFHRIGYGGPCPPPGKPHRYFFKLYALDRNLDLNPGSNRLDLEQAMQRHILAQAEVMGKYRR